NHRGSVRAYDVASGDRLFVAEAATDAEISCVCYSPDGKKLAAGSLDGSLFVCDAGSGRLLGRLKGYKWAIRSLRFAASGRYLLGLSTSNSALDAMLQKDVKFPTAELILHELASG